MQLYGRVWMTAAVGLATLTLTMCGGSGKSGGGGPTVPVPVEPTPTPVVQVTPEVLSQTCLRLPLGSDKYTCRDENPTFTAQIDEAIEAVKRDHPEYFSGNIVTNIGGYYVGVIKDLDRQGICAGFDGEELTVKNTPEYNDQYKVTTSWGLVRNFYIGTCYPAVFPLARSNPAPSPAGCNLAPSSEIACGKPDPQFMDPMETAISQVINTRPELFEAGRNAPGTDWPMIKNFEGYHMAVIDALAKNGYCGKFDGEEIQVKRTNDFTEHYDINYADQYVRRGQGIFRGSCYPAAF